MNYKNTAKKRTAGSATKKTTKAPDRVISVDVFDKNAPAYLPELAKKFWDDNIEVLAESKFIKATDLAVFELLCKAYSDYRYLTGRLEAKRQEATWDIDDETKLTNLCSRATKMYSDLASKLGMTSVDRVRVITGDKSESEDPFADLD